MRNQIILHPDSTALLGEIKFLKVELDFLLKILRNAYSSSIKLVTIKALDSYWNGLEQNIRELNQLINKLEVKAEVLASPYESQLIDLENNYLSAISQFNSINKNIRTLKVSFYEFMQGCNACALKSNKYDYENSCF